MDQSLLAPFVLRPRRGAVLLLLPALIVAAAVGCGHHKRTSLRPVYVAPAPGAGCSTPVVPSVPSPTTTLEPSTVEPGAPLTEGAPLSSSPPAPTSPGTPPPVTGPSLPGTSDEPGLEPIGPETSRVPSLRGSGAGSRAPGASLKSSSDTGRRGRRTASGRSRQAALGDRVRPFVNDPDTLFLPPKADRPWKYIVLHHSASATGGYDAIDREHRKRLGWDGCGYHFVIGNGSETADGRIEVARRWADQKHGVHCRDGKHPDVNEYGIGICLVGDLEKSPPTPRQVAAARALVTYLSDRYQIPVERTETHAHLAASPTSCPGRLFPTQAILGAKGLALR